MKKFGLILCMMLYCGSASRAQTNDYEPPDVPLDHWAYNAIAHVFQSGLVEAPSSSGTIGGGGRAGTRYEFAVTIARALQNAQSDLEMRAAGLRAAGKPIEQQPELIDAITKLVIEFAPELKALGAGGMFEKFQSTLRAATQPQLKIAPPFSDVPKNHWAFQAVEKLRQSGIVIGYPDATFSGVR